MIFFLNYRRGRTKGGSILILGRQTFLMTNNRNVNPHYYSHSYSGGYGRPEWTDCCSFVHRCFTLDGCSEIYRTILDSNFSFTGGIEC